MRACAGRWRGRGQRRAWSYRPCWSWSGPSCRGLVGRAMRAGAWPRRWRSGVRLIRRGAAVRPRCCAPQPALARAPLSLPPAGTVSAASPARSLSARWEELPGSAWRRYRDLPGRPDDREHLRLQFEGSHDLVVVREGVRSGGLDVVACPHAPEIGAPRREFARQLAQTRIVDLTADKRAKTRHGGPCRVFPVA